MSLLDPAANPLSDFGPDKTQRTSDGWLALSAPAAPGLYILHYAGQEPREMPLWVYDGWSTQVFVVYRGGLRLSTASVLLADPGQPFHPDDRQTQALDAALQGLQEGRDLLPPGTMPVLLAGKFDNPMLGLLGAHLLFLRERKPDPNGVDIILGNLEAMLGPCPDVRALRLLAARAFGDATPSEPFLEPPMLRAGLDRAAKRGRAVSAYRIQRRQPGSSGVEVSGVRQVGVALVAGGIGGVVVLGLGGRILMRALTLTTEEAARFSVGGTLQVMAAGTAWGVLTGPLHLAFAKLRPRLGRAVGVAFGAVVLLSAFTVVALIAGFEGRIVAPPAFIGASAVAFPALFAVHGVVVDRLAERWSGRRKWLHDSVLHGSSDLASRRQ